MEGGFLKHSFGPGIRERQTIIMSFLSAGKSGTHYLSGLRLLQYYFQAYSVLLHGLWGRKRSTRLVND